MNSFHTVLTLLLSVSLAVAQQNVTVANTNPVIQYTGNVGNAPICSVSANGTILSQPGCYNVPSHCTSSVTMGQDGNGGASLKFNGTAIYVNSLLASVSPIYTVTLDGSAKDIDGVRPSAPFICEPLFFKTGLDPTVEHSISLTIKGPSPNSTLASQTNIALIFSLIDFVYTAVDSSNSTLPAATGSSSSPTTASEAATASNAPSTTKQPSSAIGTLARLDAGCMYIMFVVLTMKAFM